ncbi:MAG: DUF3459 domain-containing protein [Anaerolineales bacterium]|nr:DUF3459 domain-containing protein [Anaerolineales bacterium]
MRLKKFRLLIPLFLLIVGCSFAPSSSAPDTAPETSPAPLTDSANWQNDAVFYEIFVRSFYDSNGDGVGDFNGIIEKLDYLNDGDSSTTDDLGITGIWLMPIFPSPSYHGYDVTDYYNVNPQYGTLDDFKRLLDEAHKRGIRVILDLVINHTSENHPWFKSAKSDVNSPYRNWYIWSEDNPGYKGPWNEKVWHPSLTGYYYGIFEGFMPDLNYNNPEVTAEMKKIYAFWLNDVGADGFRLDAAKHLIEEGQLQENTSATHEWYREMYPAYKEMKPSAITIGELFGDSMSVAAKYVKNKEFDFVFNFQLAETIIKAVQSGRAKNISRVIETSDAFLPTYQYAPFLTNHDQNRVMGELGNDVNKAKAAAAVMLTAPGVPFIYYGEEIGMVGAKPDENIRRPMQWSADVNAGFTNGRPWRAPDANFNFVNVAAQTENPDSLLSFYRNLIHLRENHSALRGGKYVALDSSNPALYAALRADENETLLVLVNLSADAVSNYAISVADAGLAEQTFSAEALFGADKVQSLEARRGGFESYAPLEIIPPYATIILKFQP